MAVDMLGLQLVSALADVYGDQTLDVSTVSWWLVSFNSDNGGSLLQVQMSMECGLLFITDENA